MQDSSKTNQDLITENSALKKRIEELEPTSSEKIWKENEDRAVHLNALHETSVELTAELNLDVLLNSITHRALELIGGAACNFYLYNPKTDLLERVATAGTALVPSPNKRQRGEGMVGKVWVKGTPLLINDYASWPGRTKAYDSYPSRALVGVPFRLGTEVLGVLNIMAPLPHQYTQMDLEMLNLFATHAAIAIRNARLHDRIKLELAGRERTEEALRESQAFYHSLVEQLPAGVFRKDREGRYVFVSPWLCRLKGMKEEEFLGKTPQDVIASEAAKPDAKEQGIKYAAEGADHHVRIMQTGKPLELTEEYTDAAGKKQFVHAIKIPVFNSEGKVIGTQGILFDITKRKIAEEALQESEARYRSLFENNHAVMLLVDPDNATIIDANPAACAYYGWSREELLKRRIDDINTLTREEVSAEMQLSRSEKRNHFFFKHRRADDTIRDVEVYSGPILMKGKVLLYSIVHDITERNQAKDALRQSEEYFKAIIENSSDIILILDKLGTITYVSPSVERILGHKPGELIGKSSLKLIVSDDKPRAIADFGRALLIKEVLIPNFFRIKHKNGTERILEGFGKNLLDNPTVAGFVMNVRDITDRKQAEARFEELFQEAPVGYFEYDTAGCITNVNQTELDMLGYKLDEMIGQFAWKFIVEEETARQLIMAKLAGTELPSRGFERTYRRKDGTTVTFLIQDRLNKDEQGNITGIRCVLQDITDRKQAEESLHLITDNMSDMVRITDLQGVNLYTSPSHTKILGYKPEERVGKSGFEIVHPDDVEHLIKVFSEGLINKKPGKVEYRIKHAEGHYVWLETMANGIFDDQGELTAVIQSSRDITERKRVEEENRALAERLQRAEKMEALGQLAGGVAHDLNNVLGVLSGYSQLLLLEIPEGSPIRGHVETILQSTEKGASIIQDLLTLARRGVTATDVIDLNSVISDFLKTPVFEKIKDYHPRVTFRTECDNNLLNIKGSPVHLEKTLMNLVSNAAESISGKGEVMMRTESRYLDKAIRGYDEVKEGDYAVLTVSDTGMGIPAEYRGKIFEPFYTKKTMGRSGTGLGLAIVWGTVKDHNGYIDVQTEVGEGTTFTLYFPITREEWIARQQEEPIERYMGNSESILVVDDIAEQRDVASRLLTRLGYKVHVVSSGEEAVEYLKENRADILVLDMIMAPGIDGLETYQRVLEINPRQKAILVSGFSETDRVKKAQKLGAGAYIKKPYMMEKIGLAIRDELLKVTINNG